MVSCLNHHLSILKMTVHTAYIDYLTSEVLPNPPPEDDNWCRPTMSRSPWFDMFEKSQRLDALRGLWGVIAYLTRETQISQKAEVPGTFTAAISER